MKLQVMLSGAFVVVALGTGAMASDRFFGAGDAIELAQAQTGPASRQDNRQDRRDDRQDTRDDRQDTRSDCRATEGAVGADKRDCKQDGRQETTAPGG